MHGRSIYYGAALCVFGAAAALVIPSSIDVDIHDDQWRPALLDSAIRHRVEVPCRSCTFTSFDINEYDDLSGEDDDGDEENGNLIWTHDGERKLELEFSISRDGHQLQLDGEPIFPSHFYRSSRVGGRPIYAVQLAETASLSATPRRKSNRLPLEVTSFGITVVEPALGFDVPEIVSHDAGSLLQVQIRVISLEKRPIDADEVVLHLLRTKDDELVIMKMDNLSYLPQSPSPPPPPPPPRVRPSGGMVPSPPPFSPDSSCHGLPQAACRFRKAIEQKIEALKNGEFGFSKSCPGMRGGPSRRPPFNGRHGPPGHHHGPPPPHFGHQENLHHHRHHRHHFLHSITRAIIAILIPVMAGVVAGLMVSFVGLLIGRLVGYAWIAITRLLWRREPAHNRRRSTQKTRLGTDDGVLLAQDDEVETLPPYEDSPAYETLGRRSMQQEGR